MNRRNVIPLLGVLALGYGLGTWTAAPTAIAEPPAKRQTAPAINAIDVLFSPKGGCTDRIVRELGRPGLQRDVGAVPKPFSVG